MVVYVGSNTHNETQLVGENHDTPLRAKSCGFRTRFDLPKLYSHSPNLTRLFLIPRYLESLRTLHPLLDVCGSTARIIDLKSLRDRIRSKSNDPNSQDLLHVKQRARRTLRNSFIVTSVFSLLLMMLWTVFSWGRLPPSRAFFSSHKASSFQRCFVLCADYPSPDLFISLGRLTGEKRLVLRFSSSLHS